MFWSHRYVRLAIRWFVLYSGVAAVAAGAHSGHSWGEALGALLLLLYVIEPRK